MMFRSTLRKRTRQRADIEGKLDVLRVKCTKCARKGCYSVRRLIEKYGRNDVMVQALATILLPTGHKPGAGRRVDIKTT